MRELAQRLLVARQTRQITPDLVDAVLTALANIRAAKAIMSGVQDKRLRSEIRQATYAAFEMMGKL